MAVDVLMDLTAARRLAPFMRREHSLGSAAAELSIPASTLAYWVGRFTRAGLVEVTRTVPRAGKAIPMYRAVSGEFHIPLDAIPPGRRDELLHGGRSHMFAEFTKSVDVQIAKHLRRGLRIKSHPDRGIELNFIEDDEPLPVPVTEWWGAIALTEDEARELQQTIEELSNRFRANREAPGRKEYVVVMGLTPRIKK